MATEISDAEFALLSLLGEAPRHGYELEALIEARGLREWTEIGFSSIYFLLEKLRKRGFAKAARASASGKGRRPFAITDKGRACLLATTERLIARPNRVHPQVLLGLANWPALTGRIGLDALQRRREALEAERSRLAAVRDGQRPLPDFVEAMFDYADSQLRADLAWVERTSARLSAEGKVSVDKIDFKKALAALYKAPSDRFATVEVPEMQFVRVDGAGDPNTAPAYKQAIEWLYSVSYALKFAVKAARKVDYGVPPLEGLWWADDPADFVARRKDRWRWTMMIMAPDVVDRPLYEAAVEKSKKKLGDPPASLRLDRFAEGRSLQILHVGSYDDEGPTLARLHDEVMPSQGLTFAGPHHEIYLSDARKTAPAKLKTILRQPVKSV